ncbi:MAG: S8 family serine peptidase, partial [Gammaproteobacteria bacterium]
MSSLRTASLTGHTRSVYHTDSPYFILALALAILLLWSGVVNNAGATSQSQGGGYSDRLIKCLERARRQPGQGSAPITFIIETDEPADRIRPIITSRGGNIRYHFGNRYEIRLRADSIQQLLTRLPATSRARLPWPHEAVTTISQGVELTGALYIVVTTKNSSTTNYPLTLFSFESSFGVNTRANRLSQPADCARVLAVGATNLMDSLEGFSSEGPTTDGRDKPEISV